MHIDIQMQIEKGALDRIMVVLEEGNAARTVSLTGIVSIFLQDMFSSFYCCSFSILVKGL